MNWSNTLRAVIRTAGITIPTVVKPAAHSAAEHAEIDARITRWSDQVLRDAEVTLIAEGVRDLPPDIPYVIVANHRSYYDIPASFAALRRPMRMVAKQELFRVPLFGRAMRSAGFIAVDRNKSEQARRNLQSAEGLLHQGISVWIAPEGTRSKDGRLGPFKSGAFRLAMASRVPILPVVITGTERVLPAGSYSVRSRETVRVVALSPLPPEDFPQNHRDLAESVRRRMLVALER